MTSTVKAQPEDLIALAWYQMGYRPQNSVILVGLHGSGMRTGAVIRADLPPGGLEREVLTSMAAPLVRSGAVAVVLVVCAPEACLMPRPRVVRVARGLLPGLGLRVVDALAVSDTGYRSYGCRRRDCCPPQGRPISEVLDSRVAAELVLEGRRLLAEEADLVADVDPSGPGACAVEQDDEDEAFEAEDVAADRQVRLSPGQAAALLRRWREALGSGSADPLVPQLGPALGDGRLRDAVMLTLVPGGDLLADEVLAGAGASALETTLSNAPDHELLERGVRLLAAAARVAPPGHRAGPLGALAWLAWWSGQGGRARLLVDRALADRPDHRLTRLVDGLLELAVPPPWVQLPLPADAETSR